MREKELWVFQVQGRGRQIPGTQNSFKGYVRPDLWIVSRRIDLTLLVCRQLRSICVPKGRLYPYRVTISCFCLSSQCRNTIYLNALLDLLTNTELSVRQKLYISPCGGRCPRSFQRSAKVANKFRSVQTANASFRFVPRSWLMQIS